MKRKVILSLVALLVIAGTSSAATIGGQTHDLTALLAGFNVGNAGPVTGGNIAQAGGTVAVTDGWAQSVAQESGLIVQGISIMGPGTATTWAGIHMGQMLASGAGTGSAMQGSNVDLMTVVNKNPSLGGVSASNAAISNQAEAVISPAGAVSNTNTSAASTIAGVGACGNGGLVSDVSINYTGGGSFLNPCPPPQCPPVCVPCPAPVQPCPPVCGW